MSGQDGTETVELPRITVASATDLLREQKREIEQADGPGPYVKELSATIEKLESSLEQ